jgi:hypothetical protein
MPSTYLDLTNKLLRKINEVEISEADFSNTRGVQTLAKDAIVDAIGQINQAEYEWPFNAAQHTQVLLVGQEEYSWPEYFKVVDWNSFQIQKNESLGVEHKMLEFMDRDVYYKKYKSDDDNAGVIGIRCPEFVAPSHGNGYIVSPSPDKQYNIQFKYYMNNVGLTNFSDQTRIPNSYDNVIIDGALYYMYMFRDNPEAAGVSIQVFQQGIKNMQGIFINKYERVYDTRVSRNSKMSPEYIGL